MASLNKAMLIGNLTKDVKLRYTQSQKPVATINLATSDRVKQPDGSYKDKPEYHRVIVWGKRAESCNEYLKKGSQVHIEGRIETRNFEDRDGKKVYTTEVVANDVQFLGSKNSSPSNGAVAPKPQDHYNNHHNAKANDVPEGLDDIPF